MIKLTNDQVHVIAEQLHEYGLLDNNKDLIYTFDDGNLNNIGIDGRLDLVHVVRFIIDEINKVTP